VGEALASISVGEASASIINPEGSPTMSKPFVGEASASTFKSTLKGLPQFPYSPPEGERTKVGMNF